MSSLEILNQEGSVCRLVRLLIYLSLGDRKGTFMVFELSCYLFLPVLPFKGRDYPIKVPRPRTQQANLPAHLHTIPFLLNVN